MKKLLFILLTILITFPLFGQGFGYYKTYDEKQLKKFFSTDTVKTDSVYIINYTLYIDRLILDYRYNYYWNRYPYNNYWSCGYNWYYDDWYYFNYDYWFYTHNWHNNNYYGNYNNYNYKPKPQRPIRQRTIATSTRTTKPVIISERKREYVRPIKTTIDSRYNRPARTNVRTQNTYNRPTTTSRPTSTYNRPSSNTRMYNVPTRSTNSNNNRSGSSNRSSSGSRGRR